MGKSSPIPPPPSPYAGAGYQQGLNLQTMEEGQAASQTGINNPYASVSYAQTGTGPGGVPTYTQTEQLSPQEQALLGQFQSGQFGAGAAGSSLMNQAAGMYGGGIPNFSQGANNLTTEMMKNETAYLNPQFQTQTSQLDNQLRNQGLMPGTEAYNNQMRQLQMNQNQAVSGFLAQAEPMAFNQAVQQYTLPGQEAASLLGFGQPNVPGAPPAPGAQIQPANFLGAQSSDYQAQMQAYNAQLQQQNSMMQGIGGLGSAAMMAMMFL